MRLPQNRETVLHFQHVWRRFPSMTNFTRERGEFCLEQEKVDGRYRWVSIEPRRLCSGWSIRIRWRRRLSSTHGAEIVPYELSVAFDCESLNFTMGFDFHYRGNHCQLLAEALGMVPAMERLAEAIPGPLLGYEPMLQFALDSECKTQCRVAFETRSTAYQVRTGDFGEDALSVYLTVRRYASLTKDEEFCSELRRLAQLAEQLVNDYLIENVLQPLQKTIALK